MISPIQNISLVSFLPKVSHSYSLSLAIRYIGNISLNNGRCSQLIFDQDICLFQLGRLFPSTFIPHHSYINCYYNQPMLPILLLIVFASAQYCPYCQWNACQITQQGLGNCSACTVGALVQVQTLIAGYQQNIGICQQCPVGCLACQYIMLYQSQGLPIVTLNCTSCAQSYTYNYYKGNCMACIPNCLSCQAYGIGTLWTMCTVCAPGYTATAPPQVQCLASSVALQQNESSDSSSGTSSVTIGLSVWGSVMTVAAIAFLILWLTKKDKKAEAGLLNSEIEVQRVSA